MELHLTATGCHLYNGIMQSYLPSDTSEHTYPSITHAIQAGTWFNYHRDTEGWVDQGGWLHTKMVYLLADKMTDYL